MPRVDKTITPGAVKKWNADYKVGQSAEVVLDSGKRIRGELSSPAQMVRGEAVVKVDNVQYLLKRVVAIALLALLSACSFDEVDNWFHDPAWKCVGEDSECLKQLTPTPGPEETSVVVPSDEGL
jgi:hypothetical protein